MLSISKTDLKNKIKIELLSRGLTTEKAEEVMYMYMIDEKLKKSPDISDPLIFIKDMAQLKLIS